MRYSTCCLAVFVSAMAISAAAEDLTIVSKVASDKNPPAVTTSYISSDHVRMTQATGQEFMLDFRTGQMTAFDNNKKQYYIVTKQDMQALQAKVAAKMNSPEMQKAQEQMKNLPPEVQKKMEAMMGGGGMFDVQKTGGARTIAGYACENWTITMGQMSKTVECLTSDVQYPAAVWDAYRDFAESMKSMAQSFGPMAKGLTQMQEKMRAMKGFPLSLSTSTSIMGHVTMTSSEVTEIRKGPIPPSAWDIPAGYTKVDNPMLKAFGK